MVQGIGCGVVLCHLSAHAQTGFGCRTEWLGLAESLRDHSVLCPNKFHMNKSKSIKTAVLVFTILIFSGGFLYVFTGGFDFKDQEEVVEEKTIFSAFEEALEPIYGTPKKLIIKSVDLKVNISSVGVDLEGYLETPEDWEIAGWYRKSARPAEIGNVIISAHYDDTSGRPAAFWGLKNVSLDDRVTVLDSYGRAYNYRITEFYYLDINDPERLQVLEDGGLEIPALTLITCGGMFLSGEGTYSKRLVVNAELIP